MSRSSLSIACSSIFLYFVGGANASETEYLAGTVFKDCERCPEMVVLPAGEFIMGSSGVEAGHQPDESPQHKVTFEHPFAISRFYVTAAEWDAYAQETNIKLKDGDTRSGRECLAGKPRYPQGPRQPAVCVDYNDTKGYIDWLARKTGQPYRMISEAEREYAARAGSTGPFPYPVDETTFNISRHANTIGSADGFEFTSPVDSFPPNAFGVYDTHGNVWEWVADCLNQDYQGAPTDGSAWMQGDCIRHIIRGNDWISIPVFSRSANRNSRPSEARGDWIGFRVAKPLSTTQYAEKKE
ncbi:formylglycine-generating enzyme family protein [Azotobacter vinelandii]|uniref:formylglycine-generating enzyme family protein n=1 Tax=Azotobacter vinelandii TaxID=354 RepID=UPI0035A23C04